MFEPSVLWYDVSLQVTSEWRVSLAVLLVALLLGPLIVHGTPRARMAPGAGAGTGWRTYRGTDRLRGARGASGAGAWRW